LAEKERPQTFLAKPTQANGNCRRSGGRCSAQQADLSEAQMPDLSQVVGDEGLTNVQRQKNHEIKHDRSYERRTFQ
jgi:hypothetical protein